MLNRLPLLFAVATAALIPAALAQAPHPLTPADRQRIDEIVHKMTLAEKLKYIGGNEMEIFPVPSVGLRALEMSDGPVGVRSNSGFPSTTYAAGIGLAASWDRELAERVGAGIGRDARARGVHYMLGPGVNIYRSPRNGRNLEYFGEDPFLASNIAVGYITGMQQQGVSATIKHYMGNNSEFLRHDSDSIIDPRTMHEIYLPAFEAAVKKAHVGAVMDSYNLVNGEHSTQNPTINIDILRKQFGFESTLMSDWDATYDGIAAANGGLDLEMPHGDHMNRKTLEPAIQAGKVSEATIDDKVRHILSTAMMFGWLDRDQTDASISYVDRSNRETALDSARESAVLLKNEGNLLPLNKADIKSILVVGPDAYPGVPVGGGSAGVVPFHSVSPLEGLTDALGKTATVYYDRGLPKISALAQATEFTTAPKNGKPGLTLELFHNETLSGPRQAPLWRVTST
jgi:beta-glucosidase